MVQEDGPGEAGQVSPRRRSAGGAGKEQEAVGTVGEVRGVHLGAHRAGHPTGGRGAVGYRPFHGRVDLPDREAGCAGRVGGRGFAQGGPDPELAAARAEIARLSEALKEMGVRLMLAEGKERWD